MAPNPFTVEAWSEYAVGLVVLFIRIFYRCSLIGRNWDGDDWFAAVSVLFWTGELCMLQVIGDNGSITGISDEIALAMTEEQVRRTIIGSKCLLAGWCLYVTLIWCLKACMLFLYNRLTSNTEQQRLVKITAVACVLGYVSTIIVILSKCGPIERNWQVYPYVGDSCALNIPSYLALVVTNVSTDLMILYIPLPLLWTVQIPMRRKMLYGMWLCTGVFIIVATILRCVICLGDKTQINLGTIWSIRETFVGIIAVNIPVLTPLVTAVTSFLGHWTTRKSTKDGKRSYGEDGTSGSRDPRHGGLGGGGGGGGPAHQLSVLEARAKQKRIRRGLGWTTIDNDSEEKMVEEGHGGVPDPHRPPRPSYEAKAGRAAVSASSVASTDVAEDGIQVRSSYEVSRSS